MERRNGGAQTHLTVVRVKDSVRGNETCQEAHQTDRNMKCRGVSGDPRRIYCVEFCKLLENWLDLTK